MGIFGSKRKIKGLSDADLKVMAGRTHFSYEQLKRLRTKFLEFAGQQIDDGLIDLGEFQACLQLESRRFAERLFRVLDLDGNSVIDFEEFALAMSHLCSAASVEEKATFCFRTFDLDGNGEIDKAELRQVLCDSLNEAQVRLTQQQLDELVDGTFRQTAGGAPTISLEAFVQAAVQRPGILACVKVDVGRLLGSIAHGE